MTQRQFLKIEGSKISNKETIRRVDLALKNLGLNIPSNLKFKQIITLNKGQKHEVKYHFGELLELTKTHGICTPIKAELDRRDSIFGESLGINATNSTAISFRIEWADFSKELVGPYRITSSELELSSDIIYYREKACELSSENNFEHTYRYYRAYLFSTLGLVDAYINRHIAYSKHTNSSHPKFDELVSARNVEEKIRLFLEVYTNCEISSINQTQEWSDFKEIKKIRNEIVHSLTPYLGISIKDLSQNLNLSIKGIGGFLRKLQILQNKTSLGFIENIRCSGKVYYE